MPRRAASVQVSLSNFDPSLYDQLRRYAFETRRPMRDIVEEALREYMAAHPWEAVVKGGHTDA